MIKVEVEGMSGNLFKTDSTVEQLEYEQLLNIQQGKHMDDDAAKAFVADRFGFAEGKIDILHTLDMWVYVPGGKWKRTGICVDRAPVFESSNYSYVLFRVCDTAYEVWNGNIKIITIN